jgi:NAD(P)-dependent dehydrogenase (short-subunit alcohol dehydrogenase family)
MGERRLEGHVVIVTGASRGLGRFCALGFGREGATVVVAARSVEERDSRLPGTIGETASAVDAAGGQGFAMRCDVADPDSVEDMVRAVRDRYGRIDVLVNNAAVQAGGGVSGIQPRHWRLMVEVNVHGVFSCCRAVLPTMIAQGSGSIINVSSRAARRGGTYAATKRAVEALSIGLAEEQAANGVAVNVLLPVGAIDTPGLRFGGRRSEAELASLPSPEGYVEAAVRLALQRPGGVTGAVLDDAEALAQLPARP